MRHVTMRRLTKCQLKQLAAFAASLPTATPATTPATKHQETRARAVCANRDCSVLLDVSSLLDTELERAAYKSTYDKVIAITGDPIKASLAAHGALRQFQHKQAQ